MAMVWSVSSQALEGSMPIWNTLPGMYRTREKPGTVNIDLPMANQAG